jgi:hypothetical protein
MDKLSPSDQLRYKTFASSSIPLECVSSLVDPLLPPQLSTEDRERLCAALGTSCKSFAVLLVEEAVLVRGSEGELLPLQPGHLVEAYRRLALKGKILGKKIKSTKRKLDKGTTES